MMAKIHRNLPFILYSRIQISQTSKGNENIGSRNQEVQEMRVKLERSTPRGNVLKLV